MPNTNFLQFDSQATNMLDDESYSADSQRTSGVTSGLARSALYNKQAFQASTMVAAIASVLVQNGYDAMDNNLVALISNLQATLLTKATNQDITGLKTILREEGDQQLVEKLSDAVFSTPPASNKWTSMLKLNDSNGVRMGNIEYFRDNEGAHGIIISDKKNATVDAYCSITAGWFSNGTAYTKCTSSDTVDSIVTTASITKNSSNGGVKLGNGIIINWCYIGTGTATNGTWTYKIPFTTRGIPVWGHASGDVPVVWSTSAGTTSVKWNRNINQSSTVWGIAIGY